MSQQLTISSLFSTLALVSLVLVARAGTTGDLEQPYNAALMQIPAISLISES